jgi:hypothetical protein
MNKASQTIALMLVPLSIVYLGYRGCDHDGSATTRSSSGSRSSFWGWSSRSGSSSSSSSHSYSSGTSRGGFGSHGFSSS